MVTSPSVASEGVPVIVRVAASNDNPAGRAETLYVKSPVPPKAAGSTRAVIACSAVYCWSAISVPSAKPRDGSAGSGSCGGCSVPRSLRMISTSSPARPAIAPVSLMVSLPSATVSSIGRTANSVVPVIEPAGITSSGLNSAA